MKIVRSDSRPAYRRSIQEWGITLGCGLGLCILLGILFYRHAAGISILLPLLPAYIHLDGKRRQKNYQEQISVQFRDALQSMTGAMQAGCSLEGAVPRAAEELERLYSGQAPMTLAFRELEARLNMNETAEQAFAQMAEETGAEEIREFVQVLVTVKRTGGNLVKVMLHTSECMAMRQEVEREIRTLVSGKRLEAGLMNLLPPGILLYLWVAMPGLVEPLYHNLQGVLVMTGMLCVYGGGYLWTQRILRIRM